MNLWSKHTYHDVDDEDLEIAGGDLPILAGLEARAAVQRRCKAVTVTLSHSIYDASLSSFCSLLLSFVLRTCSRPQNIELGPVPSCDSSPVISCPCQAGLHFFLNFNHALSPSLA